MLPLCQSSSLPSLSLSLSLSLCRAWVWGFAGYLGKRECALESVTSAPFPNFQLPNKAPPTTTATTGSTGRERTMAGQSVQEGRIEGTTGGSDTPVCRLCLVNVQGPS